MKLGHFIILPPFPPQQTSFAPIGANFMLIFSKIFILSISGENAS